MEIVIDGKTIYVDEKDVKIAAAAVDSFVDVIKNGAEKTGNEALYIITLLLMYKTSEELLTILGADNIKYLLDHYGQ